MTARAVLRDVALRLKAAVVPGLIAGAVFVALFLFCQVLLGEASTLVGTPLFAFPIAALLFAPLYQRKLDFRAQNATGSTRTSFYLANVAAAVLLGLIFAVAAVAFALLYRMAWVVGSGKLIWQDNYTLDGMALGKNVLACAAMSCFFVLLTRLICDTVAFDRSAIGIVGLVSIVVVPLIALFVIYLAVKEFDFEKVNVVMLLLAYFGGCSVLLALADLFLIRGDYVK